MCCGNRGNTEHAAGKKRNESCLGAAAMQSPPEKDGLEGEPLVSRSLRGSVSVTVAEGSCTWFMNIESRIRPDVLFVDDVLIPAGKTPRVFEDAHAENDRDRGIPCPVFVHPSRPVGDWRDSD